FILPRKQRSPAQRQQAMEFIRTMLEQSLIWAEGGHVPAYLPTAESEEYPALEPQRHYSGAADHAVYDDPAWYGRSRSMIEDPLGEQLGSSSRVRSPPSRRWPRSGTSPPPTPRPPARSDPDGTAHDHDVSPRAAGRTGAGHTLPSGRRDDPPHPAGLA